MSQEGFWKTLRFNKKKLVGFFEPSESYEKPSHLNPMVFFEGFFRVFFQTFKNSHATGRLAI